MSPARDSRGPFVRHTPVVVVVSVCVLLLLGPVLIHPTTLALGGPLTEAPPHLWGLWTVADGFFRHGPLVRVADIAWPLGFAGHLMDPVNLVVFLPVYWLVGGGLPGAVAGWNALHLAAILVGAVGMVRLGRRWLGATDAWPLALMVLVFCGSPFLLNTPTMGRSEYLPAALYPLHLAFLHAWLRRLEGGGAGSRAPAPPLGTGILSGLTLGAVCLGGWYLAVFVGILEVLIGLWWVRGLPLREAAWRLALVAGIAAVCLVPSIVAFSAWPSSRGFPTSRPWDSVRCGQDPYPFTSLRDLFRLSAQRLELGWPDQPPYVGVLPIVLGLLGAVRRRPGALPWLLLALAALAFSAGPWVVLDRPSRLPVDEGQCLRGPAWWLMQCLPPIRSIFIWSRMSGVAALPAAMAAGLGLAVLLPSRSDSGGRSRLARWLVPPVLVLAFVDQATWPRVLSWPPATFDPAMPESVGAAIDHLPPGPILCLPLEEQPDGEDPVLGRAAQHLLWQLQHRRPVSAPEPTERLAPLVRVSPLVRTILDHTSVSGKKLRPEVNAHVAACAQTWAFHLHEMGLSGIVLVGDGPAVDHARQLVIRLVGSPVAELPGATAWDLATLFPPDAAFEPDPSCLQDGEQVRRSSPPVR